METIKTQSAVRKLFWEMHPQFQADFRVKKRQNDYYTDIRCAFVDFTDYLFKDGQINEKQLNNYTL